MKLQGCLGAILTAWVMLAPAIAAEQSTYVTPTSGPMSMSTFAGTHLNPALRAIASCHNGASAPANGPSGAPLAYQCWVDTTANPSLYKIYDGASWITLGAINTSTHTWAPYLTGGVSGGVPYFATSNLMGSSALLAQYGFVVGGGAGAAPATITACSDDQIAFGRTGNSPLCRTVSGDITFATGVSAIGANKVVNSMLATMTANTTKCNATAGTANPTDCSGATMRTNLGLVIGTNVQAWDADLDCITAISSTGLISRTGAGTCAVRTVTAPAAGITVSNGDGVSGNPTLVLANDLAALEGLSGTGIARRTGTDAWSVGTAVANSELATMGAYTLKGNATGSVAVPTDIDVTALTLKASPVSGDVVLIQDSAASNAFKKTTVGALSSAGSVASIAGNTGAFTLANGIDNSGNQIQLTAARRTLPTVCVINSTAAVTCANGSSQANNGTYTTSANVLWIEIEMVGGGGGGAGSGTTPGNGGGGNPSTWGTGPILNALGGGGGTGTSGGTPQTPTGGYLNLAGNAGQPASGATTANPGGDGGAGPFGGAGKGGAAGAGPGQAAQANTGGGGGGGGVNTTPNGGAGGASGAYVRAIINSPLSSYSYTVGTGGVAGTTGASGAAGAAGGSGIIIVREHYGSWLMMAMAGLVPIPRRRAANDNGERRRRAA